MNVFVLNMGSSNLKFRLIATDEERAARNCDEQILAGRIEGIGGEASVKFRILPGRGAERTFHATLAGIRESVEFLTHWISGQLSIATIRSIQDIHAVGHRVVHGGELFRESVIVNEETLRGIERCSRLAPLHNPANLAGIVAAREALGDETPQVAVFDTSFHQTLPERAFIYPLPYEMYQRFGIRRYGFHGTSHRYVAQRYAEIRGRGAADERFIILHLGNGCSAAAIRAGQSVDTSMGMTPVEGLMMGTRSGDIDPSLPRMLMSEANLDGDNVDDLLNHRSGLLGVSGCSGDMRALEAAAESEDGRLARLAIEMFCYRARKYVGAYLAALEGAEAIVFTGGIGENSSRIRARICEGFEWAGLRINEAANRRLVGKEGCISTNESSLAAYVIPTDEELMIARDTARCVAAAARRRCPPEVPAGRS
jgi:acetate kinase